jgi:hypothetical protein
MAEINDIERNWRSSVAISHGFYYAWLRTVRELYPAADPVELSVRFYEHVAEQTARLYKDKLGLKGDDALALAKAFARSSEVMLERVVAEGSSDSATITHIECPWWPEHSRATGGYSCQPGCDAWFKATASLLSKDAKIETLASKPSGDDVCKRRISFSSSG